MESTEKKFIPRDASVKKEDEEKKNEDASKEKNFPDGFPFEVPTDEKFALHRRNKKQKEES